MTDTAQAVNKRVIPVSRNGITLNITDVEETRGKGVGKLYLGTEDSFSLADYAKLMGEDFLCNRAASILKAFLKDTYYEVTHKSIDKGDGTKLEEEVPFNEEVFKAAVINNPFISESLKTMNERVTALFYSMLDLPDDGSEGTKAKATSLKSQIQALRNSIERKKRAAKVEADDDSE